MAQVSSMIDNLTNSAPTPPTSPRGDHEAESHNQQEAQQPQPNPLKESDELGSSQSSVSAWQKIKDVILLMDPGTQ